MIYKILLVIKLNMGTILFLNSHHTVLITLFCSPWKSCIDCMSSRSPISPFKVGGAQDFFNFFPCKFLLSAAVNLLFSQKNSACIYLTSWQYQVRLKPCMFGNVSRASPGMTSGVSWLQHPVLLRSDRRQFR